MIKFDKLWKTMDEKSITTYKLRETGGLDSKKKGQIHKACSCVSAFFNRLIQILFFYHGRIKSSFRYLASASR